MSDLPSGTVTLLFSDIEGSTRLLQKLGDRWSEVLAEHHRLLRSAFGSRGGHEVGTQGDAFFVAFSSASEAVSAAVAAQRELTRHDWDPAEVVSVRMGLHTGEPVLVSDDYVGLDVHRAARICAAAHGGQIVVSQRTRNLAEETSVSEVAWLDLGEHRLKDLARPERIFQAIVDDLPQDFPALKSLEAPLKLPAQATSLVGRDDEIESVRLKMARPDVRMLTLTGPGGTGKTRLALQVAAELRDYFGDGVFFVPLAEVSDAGLVEAAVAQVLEVEDAGSRVLREVLLDHLRDRRTLLVLDNFEHVLDAASVVAEIIHASLGVKALVTSRAPLHLSGEHEHPVPPLGLPPASGERDLASVAASEAVRLFVNRAQSVKPAFALDADNADAVAEICARLDGLPLAIELAAARSKLLAPKAMLARLDRRLRLLTGGPSDVPSRQRTLRGAIEWSYNLLDADLQAFFRGMSVFSGGCSLDAAEAVLGGEAGASPDVLDALASLVDHSLLRQDESWDSEPRFSMLTTIRECARELLESEGRAERLNRRHAEYFGGVAEAAQPELTGANQTHWLRVLDTEHDNMRAALSWATSGSGADRDRAELGLRLAGALGRYWYTSGNVLEGSRWLEAALAQYPPDDSGHRGRALHLLGVLMDERNDFERAGRLLEDALGIARRRGDERRVAAELNSLGVVARSRGDPQEATRLLEESIALRRRLGDAQGTATSLNNLGLVAMDEGDRGRARSLFEESLELDTRFGDDWGTAVSFSNLSAVALDEADIVVAERYSEKALDLFAELGDKDGLAECIERAAGIASAREEGVRAARLAGAAESLRRRIGTTLSSRDRITFDAYLVGARRQLGDGRFEEARSEGEQMTLHQALGYARGATPVGPRRPSSASSLSAELAG